MKESRMNSWFPVLIEEYWAINQSGVCVCAHAHTCVHVLVARVGVIQEL